MRKILPCVLVALLACMLVFPASAAGFVDPTVYSSGRETVGQSTYMTIDGINELTGGATIISGTTSYFSGTSVSTNVSSFRLYWYPFGANSKADIASFKVGGTVRVHTLVSPFDVDFLGTPEFGVEFFNSSGSSLGSQWFSSQLGDPMESYYEFLWNPPAGAVSAYFIMRTSWTWQGGSKSVNWELKRFEFRYEMTSESANNSAIGSIDEAINGSGGEPVSPDGSGVIDDLNKAENGLMQGSGNANQEISDIGNDALAFFEQFAGVFAFLSFLFTLVFNACPLWRVLLYVSLSVGIFASIVGIVGNFHYEKPILSSNPDDNRYQIWLINHYQGDKYD